MVVLYGCFEPAATLVTVVILPKTEPLDKAAFAVLYKYPEIITLSPILNFKFGAGVGVGTGIGVTSSSFFGSRIVAHSLSNAIYWPSAIFNQVYPPATFLPRIL